ncbi:MAG: hypothetical protein KDA32_01680 [Phycisphaerales bacterium]|nr:hypothetical protein [Phycisphaerales bacterium]
MFSSLLAQARLDERREALLNSIQDSLSTGPSSNQILWFIIAIGGMTLVLLIAARFVNRDRSEKRVDYLVMAIDLLGLSEDDRRDLQAVARHAKLSEPAAMLLSPNNLAHAVGLAKQSLQDKTIEKRISDIALRIFEEPLPYVASLVSPGDP